MVTRIRDLIPEDAVERLTGQWGDLRGRVVRALPRERARRARRERMLAFLGGLALGAVAAYLLDPVLGRTRRRRLADQTAARGRDAARTLERQGRYLASTAEGKLEASRFGTEEHTPPNDVTLARKVESEILGSPDVPKGAISVNAEHGVVVLRGQVKEPGLPDRLERMVRSVDGVRDVENLLHLPGQPAGRRT